MLQQFTFVATKPLNRNQNISNAHLLRIETILQRIGGIEGKVLKEDEEDNGGLEFLAAH